jgi:hypothetical protein
MDKWEYDGSNRSVNGFLREHLCREWLADLRSQWSGKVQWNESPNELEAAAINRIGDRTYLYERIGFDSRQLELLSNRAVGEGRADNEQTWTVVTRRGSLRLLIHGASSPTCALQAVEDGTWRGRWYRHERMEVRLS